MNHKQSGPKQFEFQGLGRRSVVAAFDSGTISSEGGAFLLRELDRRCRILERLTACFIDRRDGAYREHPVHRLVAQRVYGLCLGYEHLNDHEQLRFDPLLATLCEQHDPEGRRRVRPADIGKALAGKATLQRLESTPAATVEADRYHKISHEPEKIRQYFIEHFLRNYNRGEPAKQIVIDVDATDDPLHGNQEGRFFHGYYDSYCYLPLYAFCDGYLPTAELRSGNIDACAGADEVLERIVTALRRRWPKVHIIVRANSGFAHEWLMKWCEDHGIGYLFGLARNKRLRRAIGKSMREATELFASTNGAARVYEDLFWRTRKSWSRSRRVVAKAEYIARKENPRYVVTSLSAEEIPAKELYESLYCARREMENRIKEQQLFADRTSAATMRANQLRLWFSSVAYLLIHELRQVALVNTELEKAQCHTIRNKILKIGARVIVGTKRVVVHLASGYPYQRLFEQSLRRIQMAFP